MSKTIVITGAGGNLGQKLSAYLGGLSDYRLHLLDIAPGGDPAIVAADLSVFDAAWVKGFLGADAVVHLAGAPAGRADAWDTLTPANVDALLNVYLAAAQHGVRRVVFASSVWTMGGDRFGVGPITADPLADPGTSPYGASKLFGERVGKAFSDRFGISTVALRIGACRAGDNAPTDHTPMPDWNQNCWLSNRDFCAGVERAILAEGVGFAVVNLVSANPGSRWTLDEAASAIGYQPQDGQAARIGRLGRWRAGVARFTRHTLPDIARRLTPPSW